MTSGCASAILAIDIAEAILTLTSLSYINWIIFGRPKINVFWIKSLLEISANTPKDKADAYFFADSGPLIVSFYKIGILFFFKSNK